jgi:hypothetical protein
MLSVLAVQKVTIIPVVFSAEDNGDICHWGEQTHCWPRLMERVMMLLCQLKEGTCPVQLPTWFITPDSMHIPDPGAPLCSSHTHTLDSCSVVKLHSHSWQAPEPPLLPTKHFQILKNAVNEMEKFSRECPQHSWPSKRKNMWAK